MAKKSTGRANDAPAVFRALTGVQRDQDGVTLVTVPAGGLFQEGDFPAAVVTTWLQQGIAEEVTDGSGS